MQSAGKMSNWPKKLYILALIWAALSSAVVGALWGILYAAITISAALSLILGFRITELLAAVLTGVRKANPTAIAMLFSLKLLWWGGLFWISQKIGKSMVPAIAIGFGSFLCTVLCLTIWVFGLPKITPPVETQ